MPTDAYIDPLTGDLPDYSYLIEDPETLALQKLRARLNTFLGEWGLDRFVGLPYPAWSQQKPPDVNAIASVVLAEIIGDASSGIRRVDDFTATFDAADGKNARFDFAGNIIFESGAIETAATFRAEVLALAGNTTPAMLFFGSIGPIAH